MTMLAILASQAWAAGPFVLDGTQPHELEVPLDDAKDCIQCHADFDGAQFDDWRGTLMANAVRDPLFLAALTVAEQDAPNSGEFCLRCHTPNAWLEGRCLPGDGSALTSDDIASGVSCDACHRMTEVAGGPFISNAQYTFDDDPSKRGLLASSSATHSVTYEPLLADSDLCGVCHEVSNPALNDFPIELTWTEWSQSSFALEGTSCQDCHMKTTTGFAAQAPGMVERPLKQHRFVGGNAWIPEVLATMTDDPAQIESLLATADAARELHHEAALLTIRPGGNVYAGATANFTVSVANLTGHKLPSGYPEGRRAWLEVTVDDATGRRLFHSGAYDFDDADLIEDDQVRTYEALLGSGGVQSYHMVTQDQLLVDTRIPPRGFHPSDTTMPVGRTFATLPDGALSNVDQAPFSFLVPADAQAPLTVSATLWYQTTTKDFVTFLRDVNHTDDRGETMYALWEANDRCPPDSIADTTAEITFSTPMTPLPPSSSDRGSCGGCQGGPTLPGLGLPLLVWLIGRRRR